MCAGVVLAGGRSSRMGTAKAALEWHGSTLLRRTVGIVARATSGPVVVVRATGQDLPELPEGTVVADDPHEGKGPVQGIAAGLAALSGRARVTGDPAGSPAAAYGSWNAGDLDGYLSLYDEGIALHGYSPEPMNKDQVRGFYQGIFSAFGTPQLEFHEVLWDGDVATIRFTMTGRHVDEFMGVPASGTAIALPGITILHFRGDRVIERFSQADMLGLLIQVGAVPASA